MGHTIQGKQVGNVGFGLMGKSLTTHPYSAPRLTTTGLTSPPGRLTNEEGFAAVKAALAAGCNYMNGGEFYGTPDANSLTLLNKYYAKYPEDRDKIVLNIKGCIFENMRPDGSPAAVKTSVENCVRMIGGRGRIDQFEPARKDADVTIETTVAALQEQVAAGNIGGISLSEVSAATIRRAAKVAKIEAVEVELSLWCTEPLENGVVQACAELDIPILAYCEIHPDSSIPSKYDVLTTAVDSAPGPRDAHRAAQILRRHPRERPPPHGAALPARGIRDQPAPGAGG
jgi:pyridoxine 4-dehydrogenase